jgi:hypothetical protein
MTDFGESKPDPGFCQKFGCPGCATVRIALAKHIRGSFTMQSPSQRTFAQIAPRSITLFLCFLSGLACGAFAHFLLKW